MQGRHLCNRPCTTPSCVHKYVDAEVQVFNHQSSCVTNSNQELHSASFLNTSLCAEPSCNEKHDPTSKRAQIHTSRFQNLNSMRTTSHIYNCSTCCGLSNTFYINVHSPDPLPRNTMPATWLSHEVESKAN